MGHRLLALFEAMVLVGVPFCHHELVRVFVARQPGVIFRKLGWWLMPVGHRRRPVFPFVTFSFVRGWDVFFLSSNLVGGWNIFFLSLGPLHVSSDSGVEL